MDISIIIPSFNSEKNIDTCLRALDQQITSVNYEIIVVDCSEHDRVREICNRYETVQYVQKEERFNPGEGRNIGASIARGELLLFVDADVVLAEDGVEQAHEFYKAGFSIFGGALELYRNHDNRFASYLEHYYFNHESQEHRPVCKRANLSSALLCINRELFVNNGGFKDIPRMQDTELTERLAALGNDLYFDPRVLGYQIQDSQLAKVLRKVFITGNNLYLIRYGEAGSFFRKFSFLLLLPIIAILKISRIIMRHLKYQGKKGRWTTLVLAPALYGCGILWMLGFYRAILTNAGMSKQR